MRTFRCRCGNRIYFGNSRCLRCGATLGFLPDRLQLAALEPLDDGAWLAGGRQYRQCLHYHRDRVCNWMVPADDADPFCAACRLNEIIPDLSNPQFRLYWYKLEAAKRYLLYGLGRLGLSLHDLGGDGLRFAFLADYGEDQRVLTGHRNGLITINIREADDAYRETMRLRLREPYRTLLGHFRHESGHYFWERLIAGQPPRLDAFRRCFGDEREDYQAALSRHYAAPASAGSDFISGYAAAHPWEDWAETWAHYLLIRDTAETAGDYGLIEPFDLSDIDALLGAWANLSLAINGLGESLGLVTPYPFVIGPRVEEKLRFVDAVVREAWPRPKEERR